MRDGRADADAGAQRDQALPRGLRSPGNRSRQTSTRTTSARTEARHDPAQGTRLRHPGASAGPATVARRGRRAAGRPCPRARRSCAPPRRPASTSPSCAPPTASSAFGSCRLCLVEIDGRQGTPASCTTPVRRRHGGAAPRHRRSSKLRRGVMELYISDHPLDCLTCSANGDCELQDMAGVVGLREVRYGYEGENHLDAGQGPQQPVLRLRPVQVHRLLPLRARLRRDPGHVRADHRGPRLRLEGHRRAPARRSWTPSASPAAPACRPARRPRCRRRRSSSSACRPAR